LFQALAEPDHEALRIAQEIVKHSERCFQGREAEYLSCVESFCAGQCGRNAGCENLCSQHGAVLFPKLAERRSERQRVSRLRLEAREAGEQAAMSELLEAQNRMDNLNTKISDRAAQELRDGDTAKGKRDMAKAQQLAKMQSQIREHLSKVQVLKGLESKGESRGPSFLQMKKAPEDTLAKEMTHDLEMNFNKIAPFGKEDTARELQDHATKTQDTLVDAVENAEVAEIKRAVFRALTRLRAATIKEFDTIARLETQAIDAYNDAHHYRAENPLAHLHEDEAPVETDKLKSFH